MANSDDRKLTYKDAGVDTKKAKVAVSLMKEHVKSTFNENVAYRAWQLRQPVFT